jgi:phage gp36-like protein
MSWLTITAAHVEPRLADEEITALRRDYETTGKADPLAAIITQVTAKIRRAVAKGGCPLSATATEIPDELLDSAIAIIRYRLCSSMPGGLLNEDRRKEYSDATAELEDVAKDAAGIAEPATQSSDTLIASTPTPSYTEDDPPQGARNFGRDDQDGI